MIKKVVMMKNLKNIWIVSMLILSTIGTVFGAALEPQNLEDKVAFFDDVTDVDHQDLIDEMNFIKASGLLGETVVEESRRGLRAQFQLWSDKYASAQITKDVRSDLKELQRKFQQKKDSMKQVQETAQSIAQETIAVVVDNISMINIKKMARNFVANFIGAAVVTVGAAHTQAIKAERKRVKKTARKKARKNKKKVEKNAGAAALQEQESLAAEDDQRSVHSDSTEEYEPVLEDEIDLPYHLYDIGVDVMKKIEKMSESDEHQLQEHRDLKAKYEFEVHYAFVLNQVGHFKKYINRSSVDLELQTNSPDEMTEAFEAMLQLHKKEKKYSLHQYLELLNFIDDCLSEVQETSMAAVKEFNRLQKPTKSDERCNELIKVYLKECFKISKLLKQEIGAVVETFDSTDEEVMDLFEISLRMLEETVLEKGMLNDLFDLNLKHNLIEYFRLSHVDIDTVDHYVIRYSQLLDQRTKEMMRLDVSNQYVQNILMESAEMGEMVHLYKNDRHAFNVQYLE